MGDPNEKLRIRDVLDCTPRSLRDLDQNERDLQNPRVQLVRRFLYVGDLLRGLRLSGPLDRYEARIARANANLLRDLAQELDLYADLGENSKG
jgi:hypothetical protein